MAGHAGSHLYTQAAFLGRNDDGSEITASPITAVNAIWSQPVATTFRLRFLVSKLAATSNQFVQFRLLYSHNNGAFFHVGEEGDGVAVEMRSSTRFDQGDNCTQQLGSLDPALFQSPNFGVVEGGLPISDQMRWVLDPLTTESEFEYTIAFNATTLHTGDTIELKLFSNITSGGSDNIEFSAYPEVPIFTILTGARLRLKGGTATIKGGTIQLN